MILYITTNLETTLNHSMDNQLVMDAIRQVFNDYIDSKGILSIDEFNKLEIFNGKFDCSICFENKQTGLKLDCCHVFCRKCLEKWLIQENNTTCPICRQNVKK